MLRFIINRQSLADALRLANKLVSSRSSKRILQCVVIESSPAGRLQLRATDLESSIRIRLPETQIESHGAVAVDAHRLADIVRNSKSEVLNIAEELDFPAITAAAKLAMIELEKQNAAALALAERGEAPECVANRLAAADAAAETEMPAPRGWDAIPAGSEETTIKAPPTNLVMRDELTETTLNLSAVADFPPFIDDSETFYAECDRATFDISSEVLHGLISRVSFCAAKESTRYAFSGVCFETTKKNRLAVVATDGRRLAMDSADVSPADGAHELVNVQRVANLKPLLILADICKPKRKVDPMMVMVQLTSASGKRANAGSAEFSGQFRFDIDGGEITIISSAIDGQFPPYLDVIPKIDDETRIASACRKDLADALRSAAVMTTEDSKGVRLEFNHATGLKISARDVSAGNSAVKFPLKFTGAELAIGFNPGFLADGLKFCPFDEIYLHMQAANRPGLLTGPSGARSAWQYVVMPVNLAA
jgi:DNA polymerase III sliding clamp (beta) subunit (PCNA family)